MFSGLANPDDCSCTDNNCSHFMKCPDQKSNLGAERTCMPLVSLLSLLLPSSAHRKWCLLLLGSVKVIKTVPTGMPVEILLPQVVLGYVRLTNELSITMTRKVLQMW